MDTKEMAMDFKQSLETVKTDTSAMKEQISNIDASIKEQQKTIENLRSAMRENPADVKSQIIRDLSAKREEIQKFLESKRNGSVSVEIKAATPSAPSNITGSAAGVAVDTQVYGAPILGNAFLVAFGARPVPAGKLAWMESTDTKVIGYVGELATNSNNSDVAFAEKQRKIAKIATYTMLSSEIENWFAYLADFATNEVEALLLHEVDKLVFDGAGNDTNKQSEVYGLKTNGSTAFAAAEKYKDATEADLILACIAATQKAGFNANVAICSYKTLATLRGLKNSTDNYLYNETTQMLGQVRIIPSANIGDAELIVADSSCVKVYVGGGLEIEITRKAEVDGWRVDFRKLAQVVVPAARKAGVIYVANIATAVTAITAS